MTTTSSEQRVGFRPPAIVALVGIGLYVVLVVTAQLLPPHFDPISQYESDLGAGEFGWIMSIAFVVRGVVGLATILTVVAHTTSRALRTVGLVFLSISSACSFLLAFFPTDILDAPTPAGNTGPTVHGGVHGVLAVIAFSFAVVSFLLLARVVRTPGALVVAILALLSYVFLVAVTPTDLHITGLAERCVIVSILLWEALVVIGLSRRARPPAAETSERVAP